MFHPHRWVKAEGHGSRSDGRDSDIACDGGGGTVVMPDSGEDRVVLRSPEKDPGVWVLLVFLLEGHFARFPSVLGIVRHSTRTTGDSDKWNRSLHVGEVMNQHFLNSIYLPS
jgi:hypothetical protein